jgi:hypothetical protein
LENLRWINSNKRLLNVGTWYSVLVRLDIIGSVRSNIMGVDAQAILTSTPDLRELMSYLTSKYTCVNSTTTVNSDLFWINFVDGKDQRQLACFFDNIVACDYSDLYTGDATYVSLGKWGHSSRILRGLVAEFGGWVQEDDCSGDWKRLDED